MRNRLIGLTVGAASVALALLLAPTGAMTALENNTYDLRMRLHADPAAARPDIVFVDINDSSLTTLEPMFGRWPWPRAVHASIIDYLARAHARVIAYHVLFLEPDSRGAFAIGGTTMSGSASDAALAASIARAGNVVMLADATYDGLQSGADASDLIPASLPGKTWKGTGYLERPSLRLPARMFADGAAAVGHNALIQNENDRGTVRSFEPFLEFKDHFSVPSLGLAAALMATGQSSVEIPRDGTRMMLNYRGPYNGGGRSGLYHTESAFDVLLSEEKAAAGEKPPIDPSVFRDKVVFVGISSAGLHDVVVTPFKDAGSTPGMFLHAAVADDVMSGRFLKRSPRWSLWLLTAIMGLAAGLVALSFSVWPALAITSAIAGVFAIAVTFAFGRGVWIEAATPLSATAIAAFAGVTWNYFVEGRDKRRVKQLFGRYVSKSVFDQLEANPSLAKLGGTRREMTVLFSDIRGFTAASEHATPEAVVAQLNEYFSEMVRVLHAHNGTLDKFVGDMVMGLFGAPVEDPNHAANAVDAALAMVKALENLNTKWKSEGLLPFDIGIGINSGEMIAGNIGSNTIMSYTVIGDAVNLASRLESLNKDFGTRIIISDATRQRLSRSTDIEMAMKPLGDVTVKGRAQKVAVFAVNCLVLLALATPAWAQLPGKLGGLAKKAEKVKDAAGSLIFTDQEEQELGKQVSDQLRLRFGVVQDKAVHKYVTLVGSVLAKASSRPALPWKFIVLDTDGVNAYAAPGGYVHITRGALSLLQSESELADMLGHEIAHVTQKHTIKAIQQGNAVKLTGEMTRSQVLSAVADKSYAILYEGAYDRGQELDADETGIALANKAGYAPNGLAAFLERLDERNKNNPDRNGLFASHPATKERIDKLGKQIGSQKLTASAVVAARFKAAISYKPVALAAVTQNTDSKLGLAKMNALGGEKKSSSTVTSAGARGGVQDRDAKGGPNSTTVAVTVTAAEIADFAKGIV